MPNSTTNIKTDYYLPPDRKVEIKEKIKAFFNAFGNLITVIALIAILGVVSYFFIFPFNVVDGISMQPNFCNGDIYITNKITDYFNNYSKGDVIAFKYNEKSNYIKRIIAMEGDTVKIEGGKVYVNGIQIEEPYLPEGRTTEVGGWSQLAEGMEYVVPKGHYFVLGDNRPFSSDSRDFLAISSSRKPMNGNVIAVVWPPERMRIFDKNQGLPEDECVK